MVEDVRLLVEGLLLAIVGRARRVRWKGGVMAVHELS